MTRAKLQRLLDEYSARGGQVQKVTAGAGGNGESRLRQAARQMSKRGHEKRWGKKGPWIVRRNLAKRNAEAGT